MEKTTENLKARAFDLIVGIESAKTQLVQIQNEISRLESEKISNKEIKKKE